METKQIRVMSPHVDRVREDPRGLPVESLKEEGRYDLCCTIVTNGVSGPETGDTQSLQGRAL